MPKITLFQKATPPLKFYQKLVLNKFLLKQFGVCDFKELASALEKNSELEKVDEEGVTGFYKQLIISFAHKMRISKDTLATYDYNIISHLRTINVKRNTPISLKYFQYLTVLFVEYYLDMFFHHKQSFLENLNAFLKDFNRDNPHDIFNAFEEKDLNKLAIWNATGSGKTILMHINYLQYRHYSQDTLDNSASFFLLTPAESLSTQHLEEFTKAGIQANIYNKNQSKTFGKNININIIENTKFAEKDGKDTVAVSRFGSKNVLFVDEGHKGASGVTWFQFRSILCEEGFSFEYSATFGQAVTKDTALTQEYAKCIIFDYSYKYFYGDGYGKDYHIANLKEHKEKKIITEEQQALYLTASLLTYYQQKKVFFNKKQDIKAFNLENPLFVFVGSSVNAVRTKDKKKISDVVDILLFFKDFVTNKEKYSSYIKRILKGETGLVDTNNKEIFRNAFSYLKQENTDNIYLDILKFVFNCNTLQATMHLEDLKGVDGEIQVKLGDHKPFALINVGDTASLLTLCSNNGFHVESVSFGTSLFQAINKENSSINVLIGAKKFTEGWNSYRVSTMGLMNIGKSEGSQIIQLFGRGVRLNGFNMSLKRSNFAKREIQELKIPDYIHLLETLNIFGIKADYMEAFRDMLEEEGVAIEKGLPHFMTLPVIRNKSYKMAKILTLAVKNNLDYKKHAPKSFLRYKEGIKIILDCYAKVQFKSSTRDNTSPTSDITKEAYTFSKKHYSLLDYEALYFDLQKYKNEKCRYNVNITMQDIINLMQNNKWYSILIPENELEIRSMEDCSKIQRIATSLLYKYFDKFYYMQKNTWEKPLLGLIPMEDSNSNFLSDDTYLINISNIRENQWAIDFIKTLVKKIENAKKIEKIQNFLETDQDFGAISFSALMYTPFLYVAATNKEITVSPVALNESEYRFIQNLKEYTDNNSDYFQDKELYIIRNKSKKGIGFFEAKGFYPDFIMWIVGKDAKGIDIQYMTFIDPHGMRNTAFTDSKVELSKNIKDIQKNLDNKVILNSVILSPTKFVDLIDNTVTEKNWNSKHVFFMEEEGYLEKMFQCIR